MSDVLGVFAKAPRPGQVKTRLAAATNPDFAARVAAAFLHDTVTRLQAVAAERHLVYAPDDAATDLAFLSLLFWYVLKALIERGSTRHASFAVWVGLLWLMELAIRLAWWADMPDVAGRLLHASLMIFLIFEPRGLAYRWQIIKASWRLRPFSR